MLRELAATLGLPRSAIAAVGDNASDIAMFRESGVSIAFRPAHESVAAAAPHLVTDRDLRSLLPALGLA